MCLGIPGQIIAITDADRMMAMAEISGVRREVNVACIADGAPLDDLVGTWTLIHVGFAMSRIDEDEAAKTLEALRELGEAQEVLDAMAGRRRQPGGARVKYVEEFRDPVAAKGVLAEIARVTDQIGATAENPIRIMEICGGHTHAIFRYGLDKLTPDGIEFIHGPGCPVCVLPRSRVDECIDLAERPEVIFTTFGDAMRVPGSRKSLLQAKAEGADIRMVYSPLDALELARRNPDREVVFFGLGFETTTPSTALTIQQARRENVLNFSVFCNHITVPPPIKALLDDPHMVLDGFVGPGHVSMVIGTRPYDFIARDYGKPHCRGGVRAARSACNRC